MSPKAQDGRPKAAAQCPAFHLGPHLSGHSAPSQLLMPSPALSARLKQSNPANTNVETLAKKLSTTLRLDAGPDNESHEAEDNNSSDEDWEKLADKELDTPIESVKITEPLPPSTSVLELYDFDSRMPMHQLVKDFTRIVDPTETMPFRPKMLHKSLLLTFQNPKHGIAPLCLANRSCHSVI